MLQFVICLDRDLEKNPKYKNGFSNNLTSKIRKKKSLSPPPIFYTFNSNVKENRIAYEFKKHIYKKRWINGQPITDAVLNRIADGTGSSSFFRLVRAVDFTCIF